MHSNVTWHNYMASYHQICSMSWYAMSYDRIPYRCFSIYPIGFAIKRYRSTMFGAVMF